MTDPQDHLLLPGMLGELARAGYGGEALKLAAAWGGAKHYIPKRPTATSEICTVISLAAARVLAIKYGDRHHDIPRAAGLGSVKATLRGLDNLPTTAAARAAGCTARYVRRVRGGGAVDPRQAKLL